MMRYSRGPDDVWVGEQVGWEWFRIRLSFPLMPLVGVVLYQILPLLYMFMYRIRAHVETRGVRLNSTYCNISTDSVSFLALCHLVVGMPLSTTHPQGLI